MWIKTKIQDRPVIIYNVMEKINEESLLSRFSLVCLWLCWNNITQSPLLHSRSTRLAGTEYSTRNHRLLFYQSWNFSQSAAEEPNENLENDNIQEDTNISMLLDILTWPCMFMMTIVLERLQTTKCSGFLGSRMTLLTVMSVPAEVPKDLNVLVHSVVFTFQIWKRRTPIRL